MLLGKAMENESMKKKRLQENFKKTTPEETNKTKPSACWKSKGITNFLICGNLIFA